MPHPDCGDSQPLGGRADTLAIVQVVLRAPAKVWLLVGVVGGRVKGLNGVAAVGGGGGRKVTFSTRNMVQLVCAPSCVRRFVGKTRGRAS